MTEKMKSGVVYFLTDDKAERKRLDKIAKKHPNYLMCQTMPMAWECSQCHKQYSQYAVRNKKDWHYCPGCGREVLRFREDDTVEDAL